MINRDAESEEPVDLVIRPQQRGDNTQQARQGWAGA